MLLTYVKFILQKQFKSANKKYRNRSVFKKVIRKIEIHTKKPESIKCIKRK